MWQMALQWLNEKAQTDKVAEILMLQRYQETNILYRMIIGQDMRSLLDPVLLSFIVAVIW